MVLWDFTGRRGVWNCDQENPTASDDWWCIFTNLPWQKLVHTRLVKFTAMGKLMLIADTSPKGGGNLQKECQRHPMAAMREPQPTQPLAQCMQTWSCQEMPLHFYMVTMTYVITSTKMVTITYVITSSKIWRHFPVETTADDDLPFRSVSPFSILLLFSHGSARNGLRNGLAIHPTAEKCRWFARRFHSSHQPLQMKWFPTLRFLAEIKRPIDHWAFLRFQTGPILIHSSKNHMQMWRKYFPSTP